MPDPSLIGERDGAALLRVLLRPGARREGIVGVREGALVVRVSAPPVEERANEALKRLLARAAKIPSGRVSIVRGRTARSKTVRFEGLSPARLADRLGVLGENQRRPAPR